MGRLIGIDHGTRRIGVALGDSETGMAFPRPAMKAGTGAPDAIHALAREENAERVVVGRLTSWEAGDRLAGTDQRQIAADSIDSAAAALILEQYFADRRRHPEEP